MAIRSELAERDSASSSPVKTIPEAHTASDITHNPAGDVAVNDSNVVFGSNDVSVDMASDSQRAYPFRPV